MLGMSERTLRRWQVRYREEGVAGLRDRRVGQPSPRRADAGELARATALYAELYDGFTAKHFHEKLVERHGYRLGYTVTRRALQAAGLVRRAPRRGAHPTCTSITPETSSASPTPPCTCRIRKWPTSPGAACTRITSAIPTSWRTFSTSCGRTGESSLPSTTGTTVPGGVAAPSSRSRPRSPGHAGQDAAGRGAAGVRRQPLLSERLQAVAVQDHGESARHDRFLQADVRADPGDPTPSFPGTIRRCAPSIRRSSSMASPCTFSTRARAKPPRNTTRARRTMPRTTRSKVNDPVALSPTRIEERHGGRFGWYRAGGPGRLPGRTLPAG